MKKLFIFIVSSAICEHHAPDYYKLCASEIFGILESVHSKIELLGSHVERIEVPYDSVALIPVNEVSCPVIASSHNTRKDIDAASDNPAAHTDVVAARIPEYICICNKLASAEISAAVVQVERMLNRNASRKYRKRAFCWNR